jgi:hypothetical protein
MLLKATDERDRSSQDLFHIGGMDSSLGGKALITSMLRFFSILGSMEWPSSQVGVAFIYWDSEEFIMIYRTDGLRKMTGVVFIAALLLCSVFAVVSVSLAGAAVSSPSSIAPGAGTTPTAPRNLVIDRGPGFNWLWWDPYLLGHLCHARDPLLLQGEGQ